MIPEASCKNEYERKESIRIRKNTLAVAVKRTEDIKSTGYTEG